MNKLSPLRKLPFLLLAMSAAVAQAQSSCSSDGQPRPRAVLERFINADCQSCWSDPQAPTAGRGEVALDWIVPGSRGDDAPLAAAASRDARARIESLGRKLPAQADAARLKPQPGGHKLRVAHGLPFNGYVGASIELKPASGGPWRAWLLLVETLPAGTEGSVVARNLVRNALEVAWAGTTPPSNTAQERLFESRSLGIPEGVKAERLGVVGWVEDSQGHIKAIAQSRCATAASKE